MTNEDNISALLGIVRDRQSFLISSHAHPDGDAIGSSLGLMHLLKALGKDVTVAFADPVPAPFLCLAGVEHIVHELPATPPDALVLLECDSLGRTGFSAADFGRLGARYTVNIDHHLSGREYADFNWIDPRACAVGTMVYDLVVAAGITPSVEIADALYCAVLTDTGSFNFASTNAGTFAMAQHLVQCGTDPNRIAQAMYFSNPPSKLRLLGAALSKVQLRGRFCWSVITLEDMLRARASVEDSEGVVNHLIAVEGVEVAVLLRQQQDPSGFRLSLRSKGVGVVDVARVAEHFGGGGHRNASGCTLQGTAEDIVKRVRARVLEQLYMGPPHGQAARAGHHRCTGAHPTLLA